MTAVSAMHFMRLLELLVAKRKASFLSAVG